jgi:murein DD-endopeptidase MepM/ murein hydrolase activator NlpD
VHNGTIDAGFHNGVDLRAPQGTPVTAANDGVVLIAYPFKAHGKTVLINHGQGVMSIYLHMSVIGVRPGQKVKKGQMLGRVGSTGVSTAPHVHWQIFVHGVPVNPQPWLETEF